ncbi:hypothetical protein FRC12_001926 [Ceratobasidium sp. 428]|nr:hypothetical protein FRC12_001926 [Ceratobasidium sp. 428]
MPPKKSKDTAKRPASPNELDEEPVGKRTRAHTKNSEPARPRLRPKMRPPPPPSPEPKSALPQQKATPAAKKVSKSGLKLASVGGQSVSSAQSKGKGKSVAFEDSEDEYGEEELDELESDSDVDIMPPSDDPAPSSLKKVTIRLGVSGKPAIVTESASKSARLSTSEVEPEVGAAKIAFSVEKDGVQSRPIQIPSEIDYETFGFRVAQAFGEVAGEQDLAYKTNRMANSAKWLALSDSEDLTLIMDQADTTLQTELDQYCTATAENNEKKEKAKKKGKSAINLKKVQPLRDFVIILRDRNREQKIKEAKSSKKSAKSEKAESAGHLKGVGEHKVLNSGNIQAWAHIAANAAMKGKPYSLETVPDELLLMLSDRPSEPRGKKAGASGSNDAKTQPNAPVPPLAPPLLAPPLK